MTRWWPWLALGAAALGVLVFARTKVATWIRGRLVELELEDIGGGKMLRPDAARAFRAMAAAAAAAGVLLLVNSAWRSNGEQRELREAYEQGRRSAVAAPVGYSNHEGGTAVDIESAGGTNAAFRWLTENAHRFGYRRTVSSEPWHWEFIA